VAYCQKQNIQVTAYSPLGSFGDLTEKPISDPVIHQISLNHQKTPAQILIKWSLQRGLIVIPKSTQPKRVAENFSVTNFELSESEMAKINSLNKNHRFVDPIKWWGLPYFK
jgi:diketogulonate reductase-like aldo/keto reductase